MKQFTSLTLEDVETLRKKRGVVSPGTTILYTASSAEMIEAQKHLESLYPAGRVNPTFTDRIVLLNTLDQEDSSDE
ncbi:hypothetical protein D3C73_657050 [compost metagenome]